MMFVFFISVLCATLPDRCMQPGLIAITFDDGPTEYTPKILDELDDLNCKATFHFTTNVRARGNIKGLYKRAVEDKHSVGLRLHPGRDYDSMEPEEVEDDINRQVKSMNEEIGDDVKYARAPVSDGNINSNVYDTLAKNNVTQTGYMYCLYDDADTPEDAIENYKKIILDSNPKYDSFIFLLHDEKEKTFPLLTEMVNIGRDNNYKFVTLEQCMDGYNPEDGGSDGKKKKKKRSGINGMLILPLTAFAFLSM